MKIGNLDIGEKLILAPMAEVTDSSFRQICKDFGAGLTFTQMVSAEGIIKNNFTSLKYLSFNRSEKPIGVQLLGNDPQIIGEATKEISKFKPDLIDFNAGCSVEKVTSRKMGSALLDDPKNIYKILKQMVDNSNGIPISIKLRLGRDKHHINILETAKAVEDSGASLIFVHARTRIDKYETEPNWEWIKKVKEKVSIPIVGNGSVFSVFDALKMKRETNCDSVMVARGALGNPFIFSGYNYIIESGNEPAEVEIDLVYKTAIIHIDLLQKEFGEFIALDKAKKHSLWYYKNRPGINELVETILSVRSIVEIKNVLLSHTEKIIAKKYPILDPKEVWDKFNKRVLFWLSEESAVAYS